MLAAIADTHTVLWYIHRNPLLSSTARQFLNTAAMQQQQVGLSAITLAEIVYLVEKGRVPPDSLHRLRAELDTLSSVLAVVPFNRQVADAMPQISRALVPDMPDRIISATALYLNIPLISKDAKIRMSGIVTIW